MPDKEADNKPLKEYRCPTCNKLLGMGYLQSKDSCIEFKCRSCKLICFFCGEDKVKVIRKDDQAPE